MIYSKCLDKKDILIYNSNITFVVQRMIPKINVPSNDIVRYHNGGKMKSFLEKLLEAGLIQDVTTMLQIAGSRETSPDELRMLLNNKNAPAGIKEIVQGRLYCDFEDW